MKSKSFIDECVGLSLDEANKKLIDTSHMLHEMYIREGILLRHKYSMSNLVVKITHVHDNDVHCVVVSSAIDSLCKSTFIFKKEEIRLLFNLERFEDKIEGLEFFLSQDETQ